MPSSTLTKPPVLVQDPLVSGEGMQKSRSLMVTVRNVGDVLLLSDLQDQIAPDQVIESVTADDTYAIADGGAATIIATSGNAMVGGRPHTVRFELAGSCRVFRLFRPGFPPVRPVPDRLP